MNTEFRFRELSEKSVWYSSLDGGFRVLDPGENLIHVGDYTCCGTFSDIAHGEADDQNLMEYLEENGDYQEFLGLFNNV